MSHSDNSGGANARSYPVAECGLSQEGRLFFWAAARRPTSAAVGPEPPDVCLAGRKFAALAEQKLEGDDIVIGRLIAMYTGKPHPLRALNMFWSGATFDHPPSILWTDLLISLFVTRHCAFQPISSAACDAGLGAPGPYHWRSAESHMPAAIHQALSRSSANATAARMLPSKR